MALSKQESKMLCSNSVQQERAGKRLLALHFRWSLSTTIQGSEKVTDMLPHEAATLGAWKYSCKSSPFSSIQGTKNACKSAHHDEMTFAAHNTYQKNVAWP